MTNPRIALIHATALAVTPINDAFKRLWPDAQCQNLLDDSLSRDLQAQGGLTEVMIQRFLDLTAYTQRAGCHAVLFTCSAFGLAIEAAAKMSGVPTLKPNEAMFEQALGLAVKGQPLKVGLIATFNPSIDSMAQELAEMAASRDIEIQLITSFVPHAMQHLADGQAQLHHTLIAKQASTMSACDVTLLAQFSMAAAQPTVVRALGVHNSRVLTSPDCAVQALRRALLQFT